MSIDLRPKPVDLRVPVAAALADAVAVLAFVALGRRTHAASFSLVDMVSVAWPFLVGALAGWIVTRAWRGPLSLRVGFVVWAAAWTLGMVLRWLTGGGVAVSFVIVAGIVLAVLLLGWRALWALLRRRHSTA